MTYPNIDTLDYTTNITASKPVKTPTTIWVVYYKGLQGDWIWSLPTFYKENAEKLAKTYATELPTRILEYKLVDDTKFMPTSTTKKLPKKSKKIKKVRQIVE